MIKIYHNNRCSKSRAGLKHLQEKGAEFEIIEYLKKPLTANELAEILEKLDKKPQEIIRKHEALFKQEYKDKTYTDAEWIDILVANPRLIQRPIVVAGNKAVLGIPPENIDDII